jgi:hypothetical protein
MVFWRGFGSNKDQVFFHPKVVVVVLSSEFEVKVGYNLHFDERVHNLDLICVI